MSIRFALAGLAVIAASLSAQAQSSTATSGTTAPMTTAPSSGALPNGQPKYQPPPAARSGEKGLRIGNSADGAIDVKRTK